MAQRGIPKSAFNAFRLFHMLGDQRLSVASDSVLATRRDDGSLIIAAWNLSPPGPGGETKEMKFIFEKTKAKQVLVSRSDSEHGDVRKLYEALGSPRYPTREQIEQLREASELGRIIHLDDSRARPGAAGTEGLDVSRATSDVATAVRVFEGVFRARCESET